MCKKKINEIRDVKHTGKSKSILNIICLLCKKNKNIYLQDKGILFLIAPTLVCGVGIFSGSLLGYVKRNVDLKYFLRSWHFYISQLHIAVNKYCIYWLLNVLKVTTD